MASRPCWSGGEDSWFSSALQVQCLTGNHDCLQDNSLLSLSKITVIVFVTEAGKGNFDHILWQNNPAFHVCAPSLCIVSPHAGCSPDLSKLPGAVIGTSYRLASAFLDLCTGVEQMES